jgi:hypothetical protein
LFATNFVKRELTGDTWTVRSQDLKQDGLRNTLLCSVAEPSHGGTIRASRRRTNEHVQRTPCLRREAGGSC